MKTVNFQDYSSFFCMPGGLAGRAPVRTVQPPDEFKMKRDIGKKPGFWSRIWAYIFSFP